MKVVRGKAGLPWSRSDFHELFFLSFSFFFAKKVINICKFVWIQLFCEPLWIQPGPDQSNASGSAFRDVDFLCVSSWNCWLLWSILDWLGKEKAAGGRAPSVARRLVKNQPRLGGFLFAVSTTGRSTPRLSAKEPKVMSSSAALDLFRRCTGGLLELLAIHTSRFAHLTKLRLRNSRLEAHRSLYTNSLFEALADQLAHRGVQLSASDVQVREQVRQKPFSLRSFLVWAFPI